ncbi:MAG: CPBP family glutamic-type intramembrane protease [Chthoniobacterales bacterium]
MKAGARLLGYLIATIFLGAMLAPLLFWTAHAWFLFLAKFRFETFFHRALLIAAVVLLWPFLRVSHVHGLRDLDLAPNPRPGRDFIAGLLVAIVPLLCCGAVLLAFRFYSVRHIITVHALSKTVLAGIFVPFIEEPLFRGLILGLLLRTGWRKMSILTTSAFFAAAHFFGSAEQAPTVVTWTSGFRAIPDSFSRFVDPLSILPAFATLFLIGWILADARVRTRSLWLPIGVHAGWILASGTFNAVARRQIDIFPWLGQNWLVGIVPIGIGALTWLFIILWLKYGRTRNA